MGFSDALSQNTVPIDSSTLRSGFPKSSAKFWSNFDNVSDTYTIRSVCYPIHTVYDPYAFWLICYLIHTLSSPYAIQSWHNYHIWTLAYLFWMWFSDVLSQTMVPTDSSNLRLGFPMSSAKFQFNFVNVSDPYAMQSRQYLIHMLSNLYATKSICYPILT